MSHLVRGFPEVRFDDVSINTDYAKLEAMVAFLRERLGEVFIRFAISPLVCSMEDAAGRERERIFPSMFHVQHDFRVFYQVQQCGLPPPPVLQLCDAVSSHGLVHVDHRLLKRAAQEMSIMVSCALLGTRHFVPPFHKFDDRTVEVCEQLGITLDRTTAAGRHLKYHDFDRRWQTHYVHTHDLDLDGFRARFP